MNPLPRKEFPSYGVVIPSAGRASLLRESLDSVFAQTVLPKCVAVVVDARWESYAEIFRDFAGKVSFLKTQGAEGAQKARELGVIFLQTQDVDYIAFLDDDDLWMPNKMSAQLNVAAGKTRVVVGSRYSVLKNGRVEQVWVDTSKNLIASFQIVNLLGSFSNVMVHSSCALPLDLPLKSCQDWHYVWSRALSGSEMIVIPETLLLYRVHTGDKITSNYSARLEGLLRLRSLMQHSLLWWGKLFMIGRIGLLRFAIRKNFLNLCLYPAWALCCFVPGPEWIRRTRLGTTLVVESLLGFRNMERFRSGIKAVFFQRAPNG